MRCSESVLELSIMPKDEDVLQLVSVSMGFFTHLNPPKQLTNSTHIMRYTLNYMAWQAYWQLFVTFVLFQDTAGI